MASSGFSDAALGSFSLTSGVIMEKRVLSQLIRRLGFDGCRYSSNSATVGPRRAVFCVVTYIGILRGLEARKSLREVDTLGFQGLIRG